MRKGTGMKKVCFAKRFAICIFISTLIFSNLTGCGKKKDSGKNPVKEAKEVAKDYIFKDEEIEGIIGAQSYVSYLDYSDGKLRCAYRAEDENYTFVVDPILNRIDLTIKANIIKF